MPAEKEPPRPPAPGGLLHPRFATLAANKSRLLFARRSLLRSPLSLLRAKGPLGLPS